MAHQVGDIRNIALVGHTGSGKTTLGEALLFKSGTTGRLGSVDDGSSHLDVEDESRERKHSLDSTVFHLSHRGKTINLIDTPGMPDFSGPSLAALAACETAVIVVNAAAGIGVNTRRMANAARDFGLARLIVVNRIDAENVNLLELLNALRETFGSECHPINLPSGGGKSVVDVLEKSDGQVDLLDVPHCHTELLDSIAETDDELMNTYIETGTIPHEKLPHAIAAAVQSGHLIPVLFTDGKHDVGIAELLDDLVTYAPCPIDGKRRALTVGEGADVKELPIDPNGAEFAGHAFKIVTDSKSHIRYTLIRVHSGTLKPDGTIYAAGDRRGQRPGHIFKLRGAEHTEVPEALPGDIIALAKVEVPFGAAVSSKPIDGRLPMPRFPTPMYSLAIEPKARGDVEKISGALHRFADEDPCFKYHRDADTAELLISGLGDIHLTVVRSKMKRYYKLEVDTHNPKIPYRETISGAAKYVEHTHKKQSGGAGQYARVVIDMEPAERGSDLVWEDKIFGGVISQQFRPSVQKGVREQMKKGVIAGCQVVDVRVALVDGKEHPVDSKDIAFQVAGRQAFKKAFLASRPILLEPVVNVEVTVPADKVGDIARDISGKRGQVVGQDVLPGNQAIIRAVVPLAEVANYASQLKSVTGGQGSYVMEFSHYDQVPPNVQQQIVANYKGAAVEEEE
ncbi:Elongation factor G [Phycisphaerae bacterium RAS1]|nr:Elongation factor G [Phycisphaerae bacterium RAS1]